jgi:rhamnogalacturonyl hydrolase YesR
LLIFNEVIIGKIAYGSITGNEYRLLQLRNSSTGAFSTSLFAYSPSKTIIWEKGVGLSSFSWNLEVTQDEEYLFYLETAGPDISFFVHNTTNGSPFNIINFSDFVFNQYSKIKVSSNGANTVYFSS